MKIRFLPLLMFAALLMASCVDAAHASGNVVCTGNPTTDTPALQNAVAGGGTVTIAAGTCALNDHIPVSKPTTITGAGPSSTSLVQHSRINIFQITSPGVTVQQLKVDTGTYNHTVPPILKDPDPGTIFSAQSNTTLKYVTSYAGTGFGMRITGSNPCSNFPTTGTVVDHVVTTNYGSGGFTPLDIDCTNGATLSNLTVNGDYVALYQDENVTLTNEAYTPDNKPCQFPIYITAPAAHIHIDTVTGGGIVKEAGTPLTDITVVNQTKAPGC